MDDFKKVLIVDDEVHIRLLLEQTLEDLELEGVELLQASDGEEAVGECEFDMPDLVFLDVMMPNVDGLSACKQIRALSNSEPYIIMLTARGQNSDIQEGIRCGANEYLTKPFDPNVILRKARSVLKLN